MSVFGAWAAKLAEAAEALDSTLAVEVARAQARDFLAIERQVTPKRTGALAASEAIDSVTGSGSHAVAVVSPHIRYASFRNYGGTITRHKPGSLGTPAVGFFGHSVTQAGSHYVERSEGLAAGPLTAAAEMVLARYLDI